VTIMINFENKYVFTERPTATPHLRSSKLFILLTTLLCIRSINKCWLSPKWAHQR
jgi:hypothetical protein